MITIIIVCSIGTILCRVVCDILRLYSKVKKYERAIRWHRDQHGDDRCWMDDEVLYETLPEGYTPPERDTFVELDKCKQYIASRSNPRTTYISPEREIERLNAVNKKQSEDLAEAFVIIKELNMIIKSKNKENK